MTIDSLDREVWSAVLRIRTRLNYFRKAELHRPPVDYSDLDQFPIFTDKEEV